MLKQKLLIITTLLCIFLPAYGFAFDATGMWDYSASGLSHDCPVTPDVIGPPGEVGILQTDSSFIIISGDSSAQGTVSGGNTYTFSDTYCDEYYYEGEWVDVTITSNISFTLTPQTSSIGRVDFTVYYQGGSCSGSHDFTITKQTQAEPRHDATGKWNFTQRESYFYDYCGDFPIPPATGYLDVIQTGNKITATDNLGQQYNGYVNGSQYTVVRSYPSQGGRTTEWGVVTLNSETQGSGDVGFVWDDDCDECWGNWDISLTKEVPVTTYTITASASAGGTISPAGGVTVVAGESQGFQITPASGYMISDVLVDNSSVGAVSSYTFSDVSADHTISVIFKRIPFLSFLSLLLE